MSGLQTGTWCAWAITVSWGVLCGTSSLAGEAPARIDGRELFTREWIPQDPRSHGGDGLGPVFNDSSCVACHNQGRTGGGGPNSKNAQIISVFGKSTPAAVVVDPLASFDVTDVGDWLELAQDLFIASPQAAKPTPPQPVVATNQPPQDSKPVSKEELVREQREGLAKIHPGFLSSRSVVLHRFSTREHYDVWRMKMVGLKQLDEDGNLEHLLSRGPLDPVFQRAVDEEKLSDTATYDLRRAKVEGEFGTVLRFASQEADRDDAFALILGERNPTALFGSGRLDKIPDAVLLAAAEKKFDGYPEITGRVAKLKDGHIGRFGWKAQKASLNDFVLTACAVELGLNVPGEPQSALPTDLNYRAAGMDLNTQECNSLVEYIADLPAPSERKAATAMEDSYLHHGKELFASVGCAHCHTPQLGSVAGIYSDLLLHDMGPGLSDSGSYNSFVPNAPEETELTEPLPTLGDVVFAPQSGSSDGAKGPPPAPIDTSKVVGAMRQEWRTPPLWGVRDSGPYLHDGRANTLEQAIALHGGEAVRSSRKFYALSADERLQLITFLRSLAVE